MQSATQIKQRSFSVETSNPDPWRRLAAKIIERAVFDVLQGGKQYKISGAQYLTNAEVRYWADAWGLQLPWDKIQATARHTISNLARSGSGGNN